MATILKILCLCFVLFGQVRVRAEGLYFSPSHCWKENEFEKTCQFANNSKHPQAVVSDVELVADKHGKGEMEGETLFLLPGRYWVSSSGHLKIQTRHGGLVGKNFSVLIEIEKEQVRCHVVSGTITSKDEINVALGQSIRFDRESQDLFTIAKEDLIENWKDILSLSKKFVDQKRTYVQAWSRQTKILAQAYEEEVQRGIASMQEKERQEQLKAKKAQEEAQERSRLFREKNNLD